MSLRNIQLISLLINFSGCQLRRRRRLQPPHGRLRPPRSVSRTARMGQSRGYFHGLLDRRGCRRSYGLSQRRSLDLPGKRLGRILVQHRQIRTPRSTYVSRGMSRSKRLQMDHEQVDTVVPTGRSISVSARGFGRRQPQAISSDLQRRLSNVRDYLRRKRVVQDAF